MQHIAPRVEPAWSKVAALLASASAQTGGPILLFAVSYYAAYLYGNSLPVPAPLWPPVAVLLAALLVTSPRRWTIDATRGSWTG